MRHWRDRSVRTRLTFAASMVMTLACVGVSVLVLIGGHHIAMSHRLQDITVADLHVGRLIHRGALSPALPPQHGIAILQVIDNTGRIVSATRRMAGKPRISSLIPPYEDGEAHLMTCEAPGFEHTCLLIVVMRYYQTSANRLIYGATPVAPWYVHPGLVAALVGGSLLLIGATALGTYRTVHRTLAPVDAVCTELAEITASDLSRRVPLSPHHDEIHNLCDTVNQTLDRLQQAVERQRRFASDASHDLRSPITAMRTEVEEALLHPEEANWIETTKTTLAGLDRLQAIVTDLLVLSRLDSGERTTHCYIDLAALVRTETNRRSRRKRIVLNLRPGVVVSGDRLQLIRLLTNLLDNAERHAVSTVTVTVRGEDGQAMLEVIDDGEGIPPDHWEIVFQRFTRLSSALHKDPQGTGLGLAIAKEIAERHCGTLTLEDSPKGARFVMRMPQPAVESPE